jgi:hypothetical protein
MNLLELANDALRVVIDVDRGAELRWLSRAGGDNLLCDYDWEAPLPASISTGYGDDQADWLSGYRGGWQELFPNAGAACTVNGVRLAYHGEASTARWNAEETTTSSVRLRTAARLPLVLERAMRLDEARPALLMRERVRNVGSRPIGFLWGHHPALVAREGMRIDVPADRVVVDAAWRPQHLDVTPGAEGAWPSVPGRYGDADLSRVPTGPAERFCYLTGLRDGWAALRDSGGGDGLALAWDVAVWPHLWLWLEIGGPDFPWYGRGAIIGLEPQRAWPADGLAGALDRGDALTLAPGAALDAWLTAVVFAGDERPVAGVSPDGEVLR